MSAFSRSCAGARTWYHRELADAFAARLAADTPAGRLATELVRVVAELERLVAARAG